MKIYNQLTFSKGPRDSFVRRTPLEEIPSEEQRYEIQGFMTQKLSKTTIALQRSQGLLCPPRRDPFGKNHGHHINHKNHGSDCLEQDFYDLRMAMIQGEQLSAPKDPFGKSGFSGFENYQNQAFKVRDGKILFTL